jgi:hypothetical protein
MKHLLRSTAAALLLLAATGCLKVKQLLILNPDGSGNIVLSTVYPPETVAMLTQFAGLPDTGNATDLFHDEEALRATAREYGDGVTLTKSEKIDRDGNRGSIAVYSFPDIRNVKLNTRQNMNPTEAMTALQTGTDSTSADYIRFAFTTGETRRLTILMPQFKTKPATTTAPPPKISSDQIPPELTALLGGTKSGGGSAGGALGGVGGTMAVQMLKGLEMSYAIQIKGEVTKHNASHPDTSRKEHDRFTLLGLKIDELMNSPEFQKVANAPVTDNADMMRLLFSLPGANCETNPEVVIEFRPAK